MCVCVTESHCCTAETGTTLSINYTSIKILKKEKKAGLCDSQKAGANS